MSSGFGTRIGFGVSFIDWNPDRILIAGIFPKTTRKTAGHDVQDCKRRLMLYDRVGKELGR